MLTCPAAPAAEALVDDAALELDYVALKRGLARVVIMKNDPPEGTIVDGQVETDAARIVPPAGVSEADVVEPEGIDNLLAPMEGGAVGAERIEVEVEGCGVEAGGVLCDLNGLTGIDDLTLGMRLVEANAGGASCQAGVSVMSLGQDSEGNNGKTLHSDV